MNEDYYETDFLYDSGRLNTFYGEELDEYNEASDVVLFVYYLDREEDDIVKPILIKTIEVGPYEELDEHILSGDIDMNPDSPFTQHRLFDLVGSKLMVFNRQKSSEEFHHYDYYDLEKTRLDLPDLVHSVDTVPFAVYDRVEGCKCFRACPSLVFTIYYFLRVEEALLLSSGDRKSAWKSIVILGFLFSCDTQR